MLEEILKAKRITIEQYEVYMLYECTELGRKVFNRMMFDTFMDEPQDKEFSETGFAFYDGRRALCRDIKRVILFVQDKLKEAEHDNTKSRPEPEQPERERRR